jgi:hypothetical protein
MQPQSPQRIHYEYSTNAEDAYFQRERYNHTHDALQRSVLLIGSSITTLLALRFGLALLDANQTNAIVSFINSVTTPFVTPFFGLFNYDHASIGAISFQGYTLVAILAYSLITGGLAKLVSITRY